MKYIRVAVLSVSKLGGVFPKALNRCMSSNAGICILFSLAVLFGRTPSASAQGTAFTYQGRLNSGASPASGLYDLQFAIYDSTNNPGVLLAGPLTNNATM